MKQLQKLSAAIRSFWANPQQRKTAMWIIGAFSAALIIFGGYQVVDGYRAYNDLSDELDASNAQIDAFIGQYPLVERDGEMTPDLTDASQTDQQYLALLHTRERTTFNERVDAENQRNGGIRLIGVGVIGLALAFLIFPENKGQPTPNADASTTSDTPPDAGD
jgi:hypothetical protein